MKAFDKVILGSLGALVLGLGVVGVVVASQPQEAKAAASSSPYTWTLATGELKTAGGSYEESGVTWTFPAISFVNFDNTRGAQMGSKNNPAGAVTFTASLSNFGTTVTSVSVNACTGGTGTVAISAAGTVVKNAAALTTLSADYATDALSVSTSSGDLVITITGTTKAVYLKSITVTYSGDQADIPVTGIALDSAVLSGAVGETGTLNATYAPATTTHKGLTWASSDTSVVNITSSDASSASLSYVKKGTAKITATSTSNTSLNASCTVEVREVALFKKVSSVSELIPGMVVYIASTDDAPYLMSTTQNTNNRGRTAATLSGSDIRENSQAASLILGYGTTNSSYFTLNAGTSSSPSYLYAASSSSNYLRSQESIDVNAEWEISIASGVASIVANGSGNNKVMQYNSTSSIFSCYSSASQKDLALYLRSDFSSILGDTGTANTYLGLLGDVCGASASLSTPSDDLKTAWGLVEDDFSALTIDQQKVFVVAKANASGNLVEQFAARYDFILGKYGAAAFAEGNFMNRSTSGASSVLGLQGNESGAIITIASVAVLGLLTTAGVFLLKKKHI
jgi:hypothetical protein